MSVDQLILDRGYSSVYLPEIIEIMDNALYEKNLYIWLD